MTRLRDILRASLRIVGADPDKVSRRKVQWLTPQYEARRVRELRAARLRMTGQDV